MSAAQGKARLREHLPETVWKAQELYCVARLSFREVAHETGVAESTLKRWSEKHDWRNKRDTIARAECDIRADLVLARSEMIKALITTKDAQKGFAVASLETLAMRQAEAQRIGNPCQPFSTSGKRKGEGDPRHLWPHVARIASDAQIPILFCENVHGHLSLGFEQAKTDLQRMGYEVEAGLFSASEVGASHRRMRLFILAYADSVLLRELAGDHDRQGRVGIQTGRTSDKHRNASEGVDCHDASRCGSPLELCGGLAPGPNEYQSWQEILALSPGLKPTLPRASHGLANRVDRQRLAGNGVVPLAAAYAWSTLLSQAAEKLR